MAVRNASVALWGTGDSNVTRFDGGVKPGVISTDPLGTKPVQFALTSLGATSYSYLAVSFSADQTSGTAADALVARNVLAQVVKELIRKGILEGTYAL